MRENGEIYTAGKNFTLPPALTALTNSTSVSILHIDWNKISVCLSVFEKGNGPNEHGMGLK